MKHISVIGEEFIGIYSMVRTESAGVFAGTIVFLDGSTAVLSQARRIWYWSGAATLSELATRGPGKPGACKFPAPVDRVLLNGVIEIIPITEQAKEAIAAVPEWTAR